jgi:hypothetical protein
MYPTSTRMVFYGYSTEHIALFLSGTLKYCTSLLSSTMVSNTTSDGRQRIRIFASHKDSVSNRFTTPTHANFQPQIFGFVLGA